MSTPVEASKGISRPINFFNFVHQTVTSEHHIPRQKDDFMLVNGGKRSVPDDISVRHPMNVLGRHLNAEKLAEEVFNQI